MPRHWKVFNFLFMFFPKLCLVHYVMREGVILLMDTSGIMDIILNAMSMSFILGVDELLFSILASGTAKKVLSSLQEMPLHKPMFVAEDHMPNFTRISQTVTEKVTRVTSNPVWRQIRTLFPWRFIIIVAFYFVYIAQYYYTKCEYRDGQWVSKEMHTPVSTRYNFLDFF